MPKIPVGRGEPGSDIAQAKYLRSIKDTHFSVNAHPSPVKIEKKRYGICFFDPKSYLCKRIRIEIMIRHLDMQAWWWHSLIFVDNERDAVCA